MTDIRRAGRPKPPSLLEILVRTPDEAHQLYQYLGRHLNYAKIDQRQLGIDKDYRQEAMSVRRNLLDMYGHGVRDLSEHGRRKHFSVRKVTPESPNLLGVLYDDSGEPKRTFNLAVPSQRRAFEDVYTRKS